jgi:hypothetical protein
MVYFTHKAKAQRKKASPKAAVLIILKFIHFSKPIKNERKKGGGGRRRIKIVEIISNETKYYNRLD